MPFANLRDGDWRRRGHGITGATSATARSASSPGARRRKRSPPAKPKPTAPSAAPEAGLTPQLHSQKLTANDIKTGQVRIPRGATKAVLPNERQDISVRLRGRNLISRWDPRYGPPERSGVIRVGKRPAPDLLDLGEVLTVRVRTGTVVLV